MSNAIFGERADQHRLYPHGGVVSVGAASFFGVAPYFGDTAPPNPFEGMLWIDSAARASSPVDGDPPYELFRWNSVRAAWELVGYIPFAGLGAGHSTGLVPDPGDGTGGALATDYLARDATWKPIPGGGGGGSNEPLVFGTFTNTATVSVASTSYPAVPGDDHTSNYFGTLVKMASSGSNVTFMSNLDGASIGHLADGDFVVIATGPYAGCILPKETGWYYITGHLRWANQSDSSYRMTGIGWTSEATYQPIGLAGGVGVFSVVVTAAGTGYTDGDALSFSGGGGSSLSATIITDGAGHIVGIKVTDIGTGYTSIPTIAPVGGGTGGALHGVIPVALSSLSILINEDLRPAVNGTPTQGTTNRLWYLPGYNDNSGAGGTPIWLVAAQGSGGSITVPAPRGAGALPLNDYYGALSLFKINVDPIGPPWVPGLPE